MPLRFVFRGVPGLGPAAELPFFASPKKGNPKKGDPAAGDPCAALRGNLRCSQRAGSVQTRCAQTCTALFPPAAALLGTGRRGPNSGSAIPSRIHRCHSEKTPSARAEEHRPGRIKGCACLSRRRVCADPAQGEHRRVPVAQRRVSGSRGRFLCLLSLSTQRK